MTTADPALLSVTWRGTPRQLYFQDGGYMVPHRQAVGVTVLARYPNNTIAAIVASFGTGKVGLSGPHPEAPPEWYRDGGLPYPGSTQDLGDDLVNTLMLP